MAGVPQSFRRRAVEAAGKHDVIFLPPGIEHSINNNRLVDLVFLVITSPVTDDTKD